MLSWHFELKNNKLEDQKDLYNFWCIIIMFTKVKLMLGLWADMPSKSVLAYPIIFLTLKAKQVLVCILSYDHLQPLLFGCHGNWCEMDMDNGLGNKLLKSYYLSGYSPSGDCIVGTEELQSRGFETSMDWLWYDQIALAGISLLLLALTYVNLRMVKKEKWLCIYHASIIYWYFCGYFCASDFVAALCSSKIIVGTIHIVPKSLLSWLLGKCTMANWTSEELYVTLWVRSCILEPTKTAFLVLLAC